MLPFRHEALKNYAAQIMRVGDAKVDQVLRCFEQTVNELRRGAAILNRLQDSDGHGINRPGIDL